MRMDQVTFNTRGGPDLRLTLITHLPAPLIPLLPCTVQASLTRMDVEANAHLASQPARQ